jgi:hypothetical protein
MITRRKEILYRARNSFFILLLSFTAVNFPVIFAQDVRKPFGMNLFCSFVKPRAFRLTFDSLLPL